MIEDLTPARANFNGSLRIEGRPERLTSDAGAIILRETMERIGIIPWLCERLVDPRKPDLVTHPLSELMRTSILLLGQGFRDQDDADALRDDAAFRLSVSDRRGLGPLETRVPGGDGEPASKNPAEPDGLASQPTLSRLGRMLSTTHNRTVLRMALLEAAARRVRAGRGGHRLRYLTIDVDSLPVEVHGQQLGSEYNGHYHSRIYHPLVASVADTGDLLDRMAAPFLTRPVGRPPNEPRTWFYEQTYQAKAWSRARRVVLVTLEHPGQLFHDHFWLITSWTAEQMDGPALLEMYRKRGTAEGHMGELMDVFRPALSSSARPKSHYRGKEPTRRSPSVDAFAHNEVILLLNALSYNVAHAGRVFMETATGEGWSLRRFRDRVLRVAARVVIHGRRATLVLGKESAKLWHALWSRLGTFHAVPAP